ncbi:hypothetical protein M422DRAFT_265132 [Sphaerobolus stellatus SS14]|uniref:Uncharacterized protein n=1 Tax=Sphaerobolus stellatus (strain SS14) TaxID=990650 RepID=A0A0C9V655_SPHS4|nr:hypothetical protein M422DRAFT_265132 [Sphaerobolus stellatus SS14]
MSVNSHNRNTLSADPIIHGIPESIEHSQCSIREPQSIDMNALREEIKATISATIKEKLRSDANSVTTVSQSMLALDANVQYWSNLSNKATRCSCRALELQLKLADEKVNTLLHKEAPEEGLLEAAQETHTIRFQLDQNKHFQVVAAIDLPDRNSYRDVLKVRLSRNSAVIQAIRFYGIIRAIASLNLISEEHIEYLEKCLPKYEKVCSHLSADLDKNYNNPKHHNLLHLPEDHRAKGSMVNHATWPGEGFQQEVKQVYDQTNFKNTEPQVTIYRNRTLVRDFFGDVDE